MTRALEIWQVTWRRGERVKEVQGGGRGSPHPRGGMVASDTPWH
jgi:hypothetical protein